jgi:hypothetical protein
VSAEATDGTRQMFRYTVPVDDKPWTFDLTGDPVAVANGYTLDEVDFWAEYAEGAPKKARRFQVFGTGHPLPPGARHVGTCLRASGLIWHLYELVSDEEAGPGGPPYVSEGITGLQWDNLGSRGSE